MDSVLRQDLVSSMHAELLTRVERTAEFRDRVLKTLLEMKCEVIQDDQRNS